MTAERELSEQGFTILPGAVPALLVDTAARAIERAAPVAMTDDEVTTYTQRSFVPELAEDPRLLALYEESALRSFCSGLFAPHAPAPVRRAQVQIRLPRRAGLQPRKQLHVDGVACQHLPPGSLNTFTLLVGVLISHVGPRNGPLEVLPGGHRAMARWLVDHRPEDLPNGHEVPPALHGLHRTSIVGRPGDAVVLHHLTPHAAGQNEGEEPRVVVYFRLSHEQHDELARQALTDPWLELPALRALA